jgi:hypothetical protein
MSVQPFQWIEIKEGNPMPELNEYVLWKFNKGPWDKFQWRIVRHFIGENSATHWMKILQPDEMKSQSTEQ